MKLTVKSPVESAPTRGAFAAPPGRPPGIKRGAGSRSRDFHEQSGVALRNWATKRLITIYAFSLIGVFCVIICALVAGRMSLSDRTSVYLLVAIFAQLTLLLLPVIKHLFPARRGRQ